MDLEQVEMRRDGLKIDVNMEQFAMALKTWRLRRGLTQREVGERWGCSRFTILRAEGAKPITWEHAYKLFAHLSEELRLETIEAKAKTS